MTFCWAAWQPYRLSYTLGLYMSFFYLPKDHFFWNFGKKMFRTDGFEKLTFFETTKFQYSKFKKCKVFFASFLFKCLMNSLVSWIGFNFYDYSYFQQKIGGCNNMRHPVRDPQVLMFVRPNLTHFHEVKVRV